MSNIIISNTPTTPEPQNKPKSTKNFNEAMEKESNVHNGNEDKQKSHVKDKDTTATSDNENRDPKDGSDQNGQQKSKNPTKPGRDDKSCGKKAINLDDAIPTLEDSLFASVPVEVKTLSTTGSITPSAVNLNPATVSLINAKMANASTAPSIATSTPTNNLDLTVINGGQSVSGNAIDFDSINVDNDPNHPHQDPSVLKQQIITKVMTGPKGSISQKIEIVPLDASAVSKTESSVQVSSSQTTNIESTTITPTEKIISEKTHILDKKWAADISAKIALNSAKGITNIRAKINPVSMGPIEILITKVDDVANITISVASMATRDLLNSGSDRLIQSLEDAGMEMGSFDINHQDQSSSDDSEFSGSQSAQGYQDELSIDEVVVENISLIDSYA